MKKTYASFIAFLCSYVALVSLGLLGIVFYKLYESEKTIKETFLIEVIFNHSSSDENGQKALAAISRSNYCLNASFISKDSALQVIKKEMGENAIDFLDENPLYNSIQFHLKNEFVRSSSIAQIESQIKTLEGVEEVHYSQSAIHQLETILPIIRMSTLVIIGVIVFFAVLVIFFVTRLTLSFEKLTVESMKLFGATRWFIVKPFLFRSILTSFLAGIIALLTIFGIGYYMNSVFTQLNLMSDLYIFAPFSGALVLFAIIFIPLSTIFALIRYLKY